MIRRASCAIVAVALFVLALRATGANQQETARGLLAKATERFRWQNYWLPNTVDKSYVPGKEIQVLVRFSQSGIGFCASALGLCQIYEAKPDGGFQFLAEWAANGESNDSARRFSEEYSRAKSIAMQLGLSPAGRPEETRHTVDLTKLVEPQYARPQIPFESFDSALSLNWKLMPLATPRSISRKIRPPDANTLRAEAGRTAKSFRTADCGSQGHSTIPYYSTDAPWVFVYVDLGGSCEKGVFRFRGRPEGGWSFDQFLVEPIDLNILIPRIRKAAMETFTIAD